MSEYDAVGVREAPPIGQNIAVDVDGLTKIYDGRAVLDRLSLQIGQGEFVAILGPSGTGKTTLLRILSGLEAHDGGKVTVPKVRSVVFQEPRLVPSQRVWRNVVIANGRSGAARRAAIAALEEVGLKEKVEAWPLALSGGEAQRVALARALIREPGLLLLDEPFAALDALTRIRMHSLVLQLWRVHRPSVLLITHDVDEAILLSDRVLVLSDGKVRLDISIDQDRPRDRSAPWFADLRRKLLDQLGVVEKT
ncbi:sulfonate transport system ATP-binding protein [Celeribacter indicus]|uniref:Putative sulfonate ABC transporter ATP-binding protein n=2 Tax=Celeribacter indicus TaxID=1208324 RepID=A0A0B5E900_9RHOB|nr:putative sulfonate ABC transporter ATP-binding protein [Celeribacter indicus]SDW37679.1 sulfonate transport system ATP-binding protein [Celeribacter indicus]